MELVYNSKKKSLIYPEYGRHVQKMVDMAVGIKDDEERLKAAHAIVYTMGRMYPNMKDVDDYQHKLWDHLFVMSEFKIEVESPYGNPLPSEYIIEPKPIAYRDRDIKYKQYGRILFRMIEKVDECKSEEERNALALIVANHIKKSLYLWNNDSFSDEQVLEHMEKLSKGKLTLPPNTSLYNLKQNTNNNHTKRKARRK